MNTLFRILIVITDIGQSYSMEAYKKYNREQFLITKTICALQSKNVEAAEASLVLLRTSKNPQVAEIILFLQKKISKLTTHKL